MPNFFSAKKHAHHDVSNKNSNLPAYYVVMDGYDNVINYGAGYNEMSDRKRLDWFIFTVLFALRRDPYELEPRHMSNADLGDTSFWNYAGPTIVDDLSVKGPITQMPGYDAKKIKFSGNTRFVGTFDVPKEELQKIFAIDQFNMNHMTGVREYLAENTEMMKNYLKNHLVDIKVDMRDVFEKEPSWYRYKAISNTHQHDFIHKITDHLPRFCNR